MDHLLHRTANESSYYDLPPRKWLLGTTTISYYFGQLFSRGRLASEKRDTLSEAVVSLRIVVTFVTWLISRTEVSSSELVL